ncbi:23640_t:CDS:2, partial [Dentiscutata erythropus]
KHEQRTYRELITEPVIFAPTYNRVISHAELPVVRDELSITLEIYVSSHSYKWNTVFCKGRTKKDITPSLWLKPSNSTPIPAVSITGYGKNRFIVNDYELLLNRWYHIAYTLSEPQKRMNFYIDSKWVSSFNITNQSQFFIFNDGPLYIGSYFIWDGFTGQIRNFRYYNFRLSYNEVLMDYSGEDPTKSIDDKCPNRFFDGLSIGIFLGITILAGCFLTHRIISRRGYQTISDAT